MTTSRVTGEASQILGAVTPKFLSLVNKPANMTPWRVVRADKPTKGDPPMKPTVIRRTKRADTSAVLQLAFPATYTDEQVTTRLSDFGLIGYDVSRSESGQILARRADLKSISNSSTSTIRLTADGIIATVATRSEAPSGADNPKSQVSVVKLTFRADKFTEEQVTAWMASNGVTGTASPLAAGEQAADTTSYQVIRAEVPEGEETREVVLEDGLSATIIRSECCDIPDGYIAVVNECAYGSWGWGQLDFSARMADEQFSEVADDAIYSLRSVMHNILLYSSLPIDQRKLLMVNSLKQFEEFMIGILDSLPRTLLVAVARSATPQQEREPMKQNESGAATTTANPAPPAADTPVTRAELAAVVAEAVATALAARAEPAAAQAAAQTTTAAAAPAAAAVDAPVTRADIKALFSEAMEPLAARLTKVEGTTVLRTDVPDNTTAAAAASQGVQNPVKRSDDSIWRGASAMSSLRSGGASS